MEARMKSKFYGWKLTIVVGLIYFCSTGCVLATATVVNPLMLADPSIALSGTLLSTGFSLFVLCQGIPGPLIGDLITRRGTRFAMCVGSVIMLCGALAMIFVVKSALLYFLCFGVLMSVGSVMAGQLSCQNAIGEWFVAKRGRAMTIMMLIGGSGGIFIPLIVNAIVKVTGMWQSAWALVAFFGLLIVPLTLVFVRNKPADIGQIPDGIPPVAAGYVAQNGMHDERSKVYKNRGEVTFRQALMKPAFWLIALAGTGGYVAYTLAASEGVLHFTALGFSHDAVVGAVATMGAVGFFGTFGIGLLSDHIEPVRLIGVCLLALTVSVVVAAFAHNLAMVYFYYVMTGFAFGSVTVTFPTAIANYFGRTALSRNLGTGLLVTTIIASSVPVFSGVIYDWSGQLSLAYLITAAIILFCAVCAFLVRFPKDDEVLERAAEGVV